MRQEKEPIVRNCKSERIGEIPYFDEIWNFGREIKIGLYLNYMRAYFLDCLSQFPGVVPSIFLK